MYLGPFGPFNSIWTKPSPVDGGANLATDNAFLVDGKVIVVGGSIYKNDPPLMPDGTTPGPVEVRGARDLRIYDPASNRWTQAPKMNVGRWYPPLVTLGDRRGHRGNLLAASRVKNLFKFYDEQDLDPSGNPWTR
ncbi:MAG: hypothetical protein WAP35_10120 [Solirubrobacterales bacterium]